MKDVEISSFGKWQWANGFNAALTAIGLDLENLPFVQPCDDTISRKTVIDAFDLKDDAFLMVGIIKSTINKLPAVHPQRWIPCSERLPEKSGSYFVSGKWASGKVAVGDCEYSKDDGYFQTAWNFDVEAWMPLPEPYQEGGAERRTDGV